ncbi:cell death-inducing p53-target protein 1 [Erpetoichthys calabaricus]|uniref:Cell death-inducing p53-target protein 1 n=1 Tax=Erpetoichthys calabaricus TaxID=27687 RepID=A0A8C4XE20_ERPCA|nr:cell death-inducing p53-target protein 1 [Erpetoichthys calabaricus]XP_028669951.1 cell death-inducing p53-target protein 1 [Erpetoichthys calabaricus]
MSSDPPPPYPGGPSAPLIEEKNGQPPILGSAPPMVTQPHGHPIPPEYGPPPYEPPMQPGFIPPHVPGEGGMGYPPNTGYYAPPGHFPQPIPGQYAPGPGPYPSPSTHATTVFVPHGAATTVTVLQGEMFQASPVQTVCPHCQQAITTKISYDLGLMNTLFCLFCCFVGCDLGCCLIPFVMDDLKDVTHTCPNCKGYIYTYKRMC